MTLACLLLVQGYFAPPVSAQNFPRENAGPAARLPDLSLDFGIGSGALFQEVQDITWPHAWMDAGLGLGLALGQGWRFEAGLCFLGLSNSPLARDLSYQAGFFTHASRFGLTWQPLSDLGLCLGMGLNLVTAHHNLTELYSFYPEARLSTGWYFHSPGSIIPGFRLDLEAGLQFRQDPGTSWSIGLKTSLPLSLMEASHD